MNITGKMAAGLAVITGMILAVSGPAWSDAKG
jgi:hypothetical protein